MDKERVLQALARPHPLVMVLYTILTMVIIGAFPSVSAPFAVVLGVLAGERDAADRVLCALSTDRGERDDG